MRVLDVVCCYFREEHSVNEIKMLPFRLAFQGWMMQRLRFKIREEKLVRELLSMIIAHLVKRRDSMSPGLVRIEGE